jgi:hypothetical protein
MGSAISFNHNSRGAADGEIMQDVEGGSTMDVPEVGGTTRMAMQRHRGCARNRMVGQNWMV